MELTKIQKQILKHLVGKELEQISKEEATIIEQTPQFLAAEDSYEQALVDLLDKLM